MHMISGRGKSRYVPLMILFVLALVQSCQKDVSQMSREEIVTGLSNKKTYTKMLEYATSSGVDSASFAAKGGDAPVFDLLEELAYGHKPALRHLEKKIKADTVLLRDVAEDLINGQSVDKAMYRLEPVYPAYQNLKIHYSRLIKEGKKDSAALVSESLNAYRWMHRQSQGAPRMVMVNIRGAYLTGMDSAGKDMITMRTIVGKGDTPTPTIDTYATSIVTHPYWNVPKSIAIKEILPKAKASDSYLAKNKIEVIDKHGEVVNPKKLDWDKLSADNFPYRFRQETGEDNSLGLLKVEIKNPLAIYLHDTNARYLFDSDSRFRSHGCVRVQHPTDLANFMAGKELLKSDFLTEPDTVSTPPKWNKLEKRIPVFLFYLGADCNEKGDLLYFEDVYKKGVPAV
jgi:murein L,D-transpeptidase YcbB/YkuD